MKKITFSLSPQSIDKAIKELEAYKKWIQQKADELCDRLSELGATYVSLSYARVNPFVSDNGGKDFQIDVIREGNVWTIRADGSDVLFLEFGSGARYGYGHPDPKGYGPGTYPGSKHWDDPKGWHTPAGQRSFGNPPSAGMYFAKVIMKEDLERIAREVFNG